jgi:hypothetical protein
MIKYTRMAPDDPALPDAVAQAITRCADYVGDARGELVLLTSIGLGADESRIAVDGIVGKARSGELWVIYERKLWDYNKQGWRYTSATLISASQARMWGIWLDEAARKEAAEASPVGVA